MSEDGSYGHSQQSSRIGSQPRPLQIGDEIPNFTCDSHVGIITLHSYIDGSWGVILAYARNNDPVACTELGMMSKLAEEFDERNCKLLAIGIDSKTAHRSFIKETQELQDCEVTFPIIADTTGDIFALLGLVRGDAIDPAQGIVPQTVRAIDALQQATFNRVGMPANWKEGEDVLVDANVSSTDAGQMFPKGFVELRAWFRVTPQPDYD